MAFGKELGLNKQAPSDYMADPNWRSELTISVARVLGRNPTADELSQVESLFLGSQYSGYAGQVSQAAAAAATNAAPTITGWRAATETAANEARLRTEKESALAAITVAKNKGYSDIQGILGAPLPATVDPNLRAVIEDTINKQTAQGVSQATADAARRGITGSSIESFGQSNERARGTAALSQDMMQLLQQTRGEEERRRAAQANVLLVQAGYSAQEANALTNALLTMPSAQYDPNAYVQSVLMGASQPKSTSPDFFQTLLGLGETAVGALVPGAQGLLPMGVSTVGSGLQGGGGTIAPYIPGVNWWGKKGSVPTAIPGTGAA